MVKINKIYTKTGDEGETALVGGKKIAKDSPQVDAYGDIDELNSFLGMSRTLSDKHALPVVGEKLSVIQNELFDIGSILASPTGETWEGMPQITPTHIERLETWIDECTEKLPELRSFVLPGGDELNASLHCARAICRRAERTVLKFSRKEPVAKPVLIYLNRLSDLLFAMARLSSHAQGAKEYLWDPGKGQPK